MEHVHLFPDAHFDGLTLRRTLFFIVIGYSIFVKCSKPHVDWPLVLVLVASVYVVYCHSF